MKKLALFFGALLCAASVGAAPATHFTDVTIDGTLTATIVRYIELPIGSFIVDTGSTITPVLGTTQPGLEIDDEIPAIVWADGETTSAQITFKIPPDYSSGGAFKVEATESDSTVPNQIDFQVIVNTVSASPDLLGTDQTPVAIGTLSDTNNEVTLTVGTDFSSLAAGQYVTLGIWRDDVAAGTGDLEVKGVVFYYTASQ